MPDRKETSQPRAVNDRGSALLSARSNFAPSPHDALLLGRISERIRAANVDTSELTVVVRQRSVTLFGLVPNEAQRTLVAGLALSVSGVLEVRNRLRVQLSTH